MRSELTLDQILDYLADLEPQQEADWVHQILAAQQRRVRKRIKARLDQEEREGRAPTPYGEPHYGALGAEREG